MAETTQAEVATEGEKAFPEHTEKENSPESPTETTDTDQTQSQEGEQTPAENKDGGEKEPEKDRGFADDPRWQKREGEWKERFNEQEERHTKAIGELTQKIEGKQDVPVTENKYGSIPSWFGSDDPQAWTDYNVHLAERTGQAKEGALKEISDKSAADQKQLDDATQYMNDEIASIQEDKTLNSSGEPIDRNKLLKFVMDRRLVDTEGRWNYRQGYEMMQLIAGSASSQDLQAKKKLAGATTSESTPEDKPSDVKTSKDFENPSSRPWN